MRKSNKIFRGGIYHIYNRGNKKQTLFIDHDDYQRFLNKIAVYRRESKDAVLQYCLLPNHFHLLVRAYCSTSIPMFMQRLQSSHSAYMNTKYGFVGSFFQQRYKAKLVKSKVQLMVLSRYIHRNPLEYFGNGENILEYPYSSYAAYSSSCEDKDPIVERSKHIVLNRFGSLEAYKDFVTSDELILQDNIADAAMYIQRM